VLTVVAGAALGKTGAGVGAGAAACAAEFAEEDDEFDDLFADAFALDALVEPFFAGVVRELDETATACTAEDEPAADVEAGAVGEGFFGAAAIVLLAGAKVVISTVLALLGCADGELLGAGAAARAMAAVVLFTGAEVFTATALVLLGCTDGGLLGAGAADGATATVEATLTFDAAGALATVTETAGPGCTGTGVTAATGAGLPVGFVDRLAASCWSVVGC
jgi:hypothetical protein